MIVQSVKTKKKHSLDEVGQADKRLSTDFTILLKLLERKKQKCLWHVTWYIWHMTDNTWHMKYDMGHIILSIMHYWSIVEIFPWKILLCACIGKFSTKRKIS